MTDPGRDWARSGAMALSGARAGPPLLARGAPTAALREALAELPEAARLDVTVLGERAAIAGFTRNAPCSAGGTYRSVRARDGWLAVSLARSSDVAAVPALVQREAVEPWAALERWAAGQPVADAAARAQLLGLPAAVVGEVGTERAPVVVTEGRCGERRRDRPVVVDLTALWAGPLCAHLLGRCGARVIKVESTHRPDGARSGPAGFYDLLHAGHEAVALDLEAQRAALRQLLAAADVVLEASRPRALRQLGVDAREFADAGVVWVSITAYGREDPMRVGFGDDVAAAAGLVGELEGQPVPLGDAIADPLAGVAAAAAAWRAVSAGRGALLDVSMAAVAAEAAARHAAPATVERTDGDWAVRTASGLTRVVPPAQRTADSPARGLGADTASVLAELARTGLNS